MKVLFIGGTGTISTEAARLAVHKGIDLYILNRGNRPNRVPEGCKVILGDIDSPETANMLRDMHFDVVMDYIVFKPEQAERDVRLFSGKCGQYLCISSACVYRKPLSFFPITESACVSDSPWDYARDKIACEKVLREAYLKEKFPITIVRPTHTYSDVSLPVGLRGKTGSWSVADRMLRGESVIVHGDGLTLWTITHSRDVAKGIVGLLGNVHAIGESVHITSDEVLTWDDLYHLIAGALGVKANLIHVSTEMITAFFPEEYGHFMGDTAHCAIYDNTKIKRLVPDFAATTLSSTGIRDTVNYFLNHPELQKKDPEFDAVCSRLIGAYEQFKRAAVW